MPEHASLLDRTRALLREALAVYRGTEHEARLTATLGRLDEPLRVAVAGRVKAGKSTLLNALVGERLAATDAGECTRIVTWYVDGHTYRVTLRPRSGPERTASFHRDDGAIEVDLGGLAAQDVEEMVVSWPSAQLRRATLVDTPGIGSLTESVTRRAWELLAAEEEESPADAVVYLMRHLHAGDVDFLRAFQDSEMSRPNPVNAIAVLSRADEIGVGRPDSMTSARRIAARLSADPTLRRVVQTVVPVAGLLAETAVTLTETEVAHLRTIAGRTPREVEGLLLTADRFLTQLPDLGLTEFERRHLLGRFGVFGVRLASTILRRGPVTATELSHDLIERSGLEDLRGVLQSLFFSRRDVLKSRSALLGLEALTAEHPRPGSLELSARIEEVLASAHAFTELRTLSAIRAGWVAGKPEVIEELERLIGGTGTTKPERLGLSADAGPEQVSAAATEALARWQRRAENPLTSHQLGVAARVAIRSCEGMLADLGRPDQPAK
jgi:dynamin family protein